MKYAIIGKGFIFSRHEKSIKETGGEVILTCDIDKTKQPDYTDWKAMFNSTKFLEEVDAVSICTPNYLHREIAAEALRLGKRVLCEKPLSTTGYQGLEGVNTVLQLRNHQKIKELKEKKVIWADIELHMKRGEDYWKGWKGDNEKSGGILYNLGIHYVDLLIHILGNPVEIISSAGDNKHWHKLSVRFERGNGNLFIGAGEVKPKRVLRFVEEGQQVMDISLSDKDNLSYEDLHTEVYQDFIKGNGIPLSEAKKSLQLVADLIKFNG